MLYETVATYRLGREVEQITTPLLMTDPDEERFWPRQSRQLYEWLRGPKEIVRFSSELGAGGHFEPLASAQREAEIFDWLDRFLSS